MNNKIKDKLKGKIKNNWQAEDEVCPHCQQTTKIARGFNKQNLKRLVFGKPSGTDWVIFFIIIMNLFMAWAYYHDTTQCRLTIENIDQICLDYHEDLIARASLNEKLNQSWAQTQTQTQAQTDTPQINLTAFIIKNQKEDGVT